MIFLSHPSVSEAAVVGVTDKFGKTKITAYLVAKKNQEILLAEVTNWLSRSCTLDYFPRKIQVVQELPRNENKKIDRRSLKQHA
jgi:fatty-acyl-CoA synthase